MTANRKGVEWGKQRAASVVFVVALAWAVAWPRADARPAPDLTAKAKARQDAVKSFEVKFKQTEVVAAGGVSELVGTGTPFSPKGAVPAKEATLVSENRLVVSGSHFRYEDEHPTWYVPHGVLHQRRRVLVANGSVAKSFFPKGIIGDGRVAGVIEQQGWHSWGNSRLFSPIMMALRGVESTLSACDLRLLKAVGGTLPIGEVTCTRFDLGADPATRRTYWMDGEGLLRRYREEKNNKLVSQIDVRYESRAGIETFPTAWSITDHSADGRAKTSTTVEVVEARVNPRVDASEFEVTFPEGSLVYDRKTKKDYRVRADGRMVEDRPLPGTRPETRQQDEAGGWFRYRYWAAAGAGLLALALLGYSLRKRSRNSQSP